jgi:hypothetical protein
MKNVQMIDPALNATFSIFQVSDEDFDVIFPDGRDMEFFEDFIERAGQQAGVILDRLWRQPILKKNAQGIHGTLFEQWDERKKYFPSTLREVDWDESAINADQRLLFRSHR